jgi:antitoxin (DNA-binding transcriptional repressor) of toxin-antitoxin stability system
LKGRHGMMQVSVEDISRDLSPSLQRVKAGATWVIVRAGHPVPQSVLLLAAGHR